MASVEQLFDWPDKEVDVDSGVPRPLYPMWTNRKARLVERYLFRFLMVTRHGTYIDGFAGPQNVDDKNSWTAKRVVDLEPAWIQHFYWCDNDPGQVRHLQRLKAQHPDRHIEVFQGDFNRKVKQVLERGAIDEKEAAFCLLDQRTNECRWETVRRLASHKKGLKIELFYFLAQM